MRQLYRTSNLIRNSTEVKHHVSLTQLQHGNSGSKVKQGKKSKQNTCKQKISSSICVRHISSKIYPEQISEMSPSFQERHCVSRHTITHLFTIYFVLYNCKKISCSSFSLYFGSAYLKKKDYPQIFTTKIN